VVTRCGQDPFAKPEPCSLQFVVARDELGLTSSNLEPKEGNVSTTRTRLAVIPLALMIGSLISPAYSQSESKVGASTPTAMGSTKPDPGKPAEEKSMPSSAPAATTAQTTGATNQSKTVKAMNDKAKSDVEASGK
jgi:hypothetical protein